MFKKTNSNQGAIMKKYILAIGLGVLGFTSSGFAAATVGQPAPDFSVVDSQGKTQSLAAYKGKYVVLEWLNHGCPFVRKHYDVGNMQKLQETYAAKGVVWLSVVSSAKGKEGYVDAAGAEKERADNKSKAAAILLDAEGKVGKLYDAKTTPHMFIIDPSGKLIYAGAIDDKASADSKDIATSKNYVSKALDEALAGKPVADASTKAYGCSVKYGSK